MDKEKSARSQGRGAEHMRIKPGTIKRLLAQMAAFKGRLALVILCLIISAAVGASTALFLRDIQGEILRLCLGNLRLVRRD